MLSVYLFRTQDTTFLHNHLEQKELSSKWFGIFCSELIYKLLNIKVDLRKGGFEPPRSCERQPLKLVRLPVPPLPHMRA